MFVVAEITSLTSISNFFVAKESPFVIAKKFYYGTSNEEIASFWTTTFGVTEEVSDRTYITGVVYDLVINYSVKGNLAECLASQQSYFWDDAAQILYIHLNINHMLNYTNSNMDYGNAIGLTDDKIRYFNNKPYFPYLRSFPAVTVSVDKLNYNKLSFIVDHLICDNRTSYFNVFKTKPLYGNKVIIKTGEDGDTYNDLVPRATYYVEDYNFSSFDFDISIQDLRKTLTAQVPDKIFNVTDYPYIGDNTIGTIIPFGYGNLHDVPGFCINEKEVDGTHDPKFKFLDVLVASTTADITVYVLNINKVWVEDTGISLDNITGIVTVPSAKAISGANYDVLEVKADCKGVQNTYASDIIKDLNERFLYTTYDTSNYDTTTWEAEETYLKPISLYMSETKDIYEWIRDIQSLSSVGFRYTNTPDNKRVIRVDNPNRATLLTIPSIHIKNPAKVVAQSNKDDVYNKIYIGYNKSIKNNTAAKIENQDYLDKSYTQYHIVRVYDKISGLELPADATNRAKIQSEDISFIHKIFNVQLIGEKYLDLQIYDVVDLELTLYKRVFEQNGVIIEVYESEDDWRARVDANEKYNETTNPLNTELVGDAYFETVHGQVISVQPNYKLKINNVSIRQRDYSSVWESIYG